MPRKHPPSCLIIYNHGFGQTITSIAGNSPQSSFVQSLANAGYVVIASQYRNLACWGDRECARIIELADPLAFVLNLTPQPFVIGESMGGIVTWNAISLGTVKPLAVVGIYPAGVTGANILQKHSALTIQSGYGFYSPAEYSTATAGFDPLLTPAHTFAGFPILIWASNSDQAVPRSKNEDPFSAAINAAKGSVTIRTSHV